jgi:hypothetical protein
MGNLQQWTRNRDLILGRDKDFLFSTASRFAVGPTEPLVWLVPRVKLTTHLYLVSKVKKEWSWTPTPPYVFMVWCVIKQRDNSSRRKCHCVKSVSLNGLRKGYEIVVNTFGPGTKLSVYCYRSGSSELCFQQLCHLIEVRKHLAHHHGRPEKTYLTVLAGRLFSLLPNKHKVQIVEMFPPSTDPYVWQALSVKALPEKLRATVTESLVRSAILHTERFLTLPASLELYSLMVCIRSLLIVSPVK